MFSGTFAPAGDGGGGGPAETALVRGKVYCRELRCADSAGHVQFNVGDALAAETRERETLQDRINGVNSVVLQLQSALAALGGRFDKLQPPPPPPPAASGDGEPPSDERLLACEDALATLTTDMAFVRTSCAAARTERQQQWEDLGSCTERLGTLESRVSADISELGREQRALEHRVSENDVALRGAQYATTALQTTVGAAHEAILELKESTMAASVGTAMAMAAAAAEKAAAAPPPPPPSVPVQQQQPPPPPQSVGYHLREVIVVEPDVMANGTFEIPVVPPPAPASSGGGGGAVAGPAAGDHAEQQPGQPRSIVAAPLTVSSGHVLRVSLHFTASAVSSAHGTSNYCESRLMLSAVVDNVVVSSASQSVQETTAANKMKAACVTLPPTWMTLVPGRTHSIRFVWGQTPPPLGQLPLRSKPGWTRAAVCVYEFSEDAPL